MKQVVEECSPFRPFAVGESLAEDKGDWKMVKFPKNDSPSGDQMLRDAKTLMEYHFEHFTLHGIRFGRGMKTISTPRFSKGILITWPFGTLGFSLTENPNYSHIHIKEYFKHNFEDLCHIYLYGYVKYNQEDSTMPARITRRKPLDKINYLMMVRWKFPTTTKGKTQRRGQLSSLLRRRSRRSCGLQQNFYINDQCGG